LGTSTEALSQALSQEFDPLPRVIPEDPAGISDVAGITSVLRAKGRADVGGVRGSAGVIAAFMVARSLERPLVFVVADADHAKTVAADLAFAAGRARDADTADVAVLDAPDTSPYAEVAPDRRGAMQRMGVLHRLRTQTPSAIIVTGAALARRLPPRSALLAHTATLRAEGECVPGELALALATAGYLRVPLVEDPGCFCVRGSIIDVWPPHLPRPVRAELYGDLVLSLRTFEPDDQKTTKEAPLALVDMPPVREAVLASDTVRRARERIGQACDAINLPTLKARALLGDLEAGRAFFGADAYLASYYEALDTAWDYLPTDALYVVDEPSVVDASVRAWVEHAKADEHRHPDRPAPPLHDLVLDAEEALGKLPARTLLTLAPHLVHGDQDGGIAQVQVPMDLATSDQDDLARAMKKARSAKGHASALEPLLRRIDHFLAHGLTVYLAARSEAQADRLGSLLGHRGAQVRRSKESFEAPTTRSLTPRAEIVVGPLARGCILPLDGLALITEEEIFGSRAHRKKERKASASKGQAFSEDLRNLAVGDYVVHTEHGIGRYAGLVHRSVGGQTVDLLSVEYAGGDKLYLPVYRLNQVQKYSGAEQGEPKLDRLGGATFAKTRAKVEKAVRQMADELLRLYAERQAVVGHALEPAGDDYTAFEATFPFDETQDQAKAIEDVSNDLSAERPMDRLVCGDVGFGKTEVALRAAFRVAQAGRQVAVLCPTTVLAQQHLRTFEQRMRDYPIVVRGMSRFQTKGEQDATLKGLKDGTVDVVVGTHRLLSKDVHFKNLGLLVVDEEQRFGVTHKERIKQLRTNVDVLTLSATPIPRTLQMAVSGLRDLSLITTPPSDRRAVRTVVSKIDPVVISEAVRRELSRGGQIFYVYNRVEGLYERAQRLAELVPEARVAVAHGQMSETALEKTMLDFVDGAFDILVATAIIESGLDIPRANTIIIDRADLFGLSQLYQLRGRVGRSKERAYCYLLVPSPKDISDEARARIDAIERHSELGSGFQVAQLDLELRGGGDLLGAEQSGNVASVGFELFCQMLESAVHELRGEPQVHDVDPELSFDVDALLPESYIDDVGVRLSLYKRLASANDEAHVADLAAEMEDRFGPPPDDARNLVQLMTLKAELRRFRVLGCEAGARMVTLHLREDTPLDAQKILALVNKPKSPFKLTPDMRLSRRFEGGNGLGNAEVLLGELAHCLR
jgi:transcription-repair coupling factor (superfamily II helicase)